MDFRRRDAEEGTQTREVVVKGAISVHRVDVLRGLLVVHAKLRDRRHLVHRREVIEERKDGRDRGCHRLLADL